MAFLLLPRFGGGDGGGGSPTETLAPLTEAGELWFSFFFIVTTNDRTQLVQLARSSRLFVWPKLEP